MKDFEKEFGIWLEKSFEVKIPNEVKAFSFNLYEGGSDYFGIELIGASAFDFEDEDWACEEIWEPQMRQLSIPINYSGDSWQECLARMKNLTIRFLNSDSNVAKELKSREGVGIGFVDGNLEIIWSKKPR